MRPILVVVSAPLLQLFAGICKRQEPVCVQALRPEPPVERFDVGIVCRLAGPGEVQRDVVGIGPQVQVAADELGEFCVQRQVAFGIEVEAVGPDDVRP